MMERDGGVLEWSRMHQCEFAIEKFGVMGLTRRREKNPGGHPATQPVERKPVQIRQVTVPAVNEHKFLGVVIDQELRWNVHISYALAKGTTWITQYRWLAKATKGISAKYMRRFYISVAVPRMLYAADLFLIPQCVKPKDQRGSLRS